MGTWTAFWIAIAAGFGLGLAALLIIPFREEWRLKIRAMIKVGPQGAEFTPPPPSQELDAAKDKGAGQALARPAVYPPGLAPWREQLEEILQQQTFSDTELVEQLKHATVSLRRLVDFHTAARVIFGTQISALRHMAGSENGLSSDELKTLFSEHELRRLSAGLSTGDYLAWIGFLLSQKLVKLEDGRYRATAAGADALDFFNSLGVDEQKAF